MSLNVPALRAMLDGEHAAVRDQVREVLETPEFAPIAEIGRDEYRQRVFEQLRGLAEAGHTARAYPTKYGGEGDVGGSIAGFETFAFGDLSLLVKLGVQFGLWGGAVLHLGTAKHHEAYLADTPTLALPGCFAMTETGHGSNVQDLRTTATYDDDAHEFVIHTPDEDARKDYIGNAAVHGRIAAVFAQLVVTGEKRGVHCLVVPIRDEDGSPLPGVTISDDGVKLGLNGVDNGRISFDNVRVPRDALLDRYAQVNEAGVYFSPIENANKRFFTMLGTLIQGRVSVGGAGISVAKVALTVAIRRSLTRRQFGPPDGDEEVTLWHYRTQQRRLMPLLATTYALHFAQEETLAETHRAFSADDYPDKERRQLETRAAALKATATWHARDTVQECREACGGWGYLAESRFAALKADSDVFTTFEGDNLVLRQLVAKNLLTDFQHELGDLNPIGMAGFIAEQVVDRIVERTALGELMGRLADDILPGRAADPDLLDRELQLELFRWREEHLRGSAARRIRGGIDQGYDPFEVLIYCQDHVVDCARVHTERIVLEAFDNAVQRCEDPANKEVLNNLCSLYALWHVERDRGWFQEHGRLSSTRSKAVLKTVNHLLDDLRDHAEGLVEAFGVPEQQLKSVAAVGSTA
jgi:acyl-CoA oxidase